jgi:branched-chain amino acid transport system permease protein
MQLHEQIIQVLLIGIANGAIIALVALGYTLVYGIIELINFAHGDVFMIGTMVALSITTWAASVAGVRGAFMLPGNILVFLVPGMIVASMVACAVLNVAIERVAYRRLRNAPRLAPLISAIGMSFILVNVGLLWKGASQVNFPDLIPRIDIFSDLLGINTLILFTLKDLLVVAIAIPLMIGLNMFVQRTRLGKAMRATAQDRETAALMGIDINLTIALTFLIGGALAGAAGAIYGLYNNSAWYFQGFRGGLYAFTAAVMGGIGNLRGAFLGGMLIGLVSAISDWVLQAQWTPAIVFGLLVVILIFRPTGLLSEEVSERA